MANKLTNRGFLGPESLALSVNERHDRNRLRDEIDMNSFNWRVFAVAASGFFTDSYNLFATNVILPSIAFVYWQNDTNAWRETLINVTTLAGSILGQVLFGYLADRYGRTRLYGIELVIVIFSTIGVASSTTGVGNDMAILGWLSSWRLLMGVGIGAEYPLSAVITSEWASTKARARMMAAVFLMQPLGQLAAQLVGLLVTLGINNQMDLQHKCINPKDPTCISGVDRIWRIVTGVGAGPALLAIVFRFLIWDSGLYDLEVKKETPRAFRNTQRVYRNVRVNSSPNIAFQNDNPNAKEDDTHTPLQFSKHDLHRYFIAEGNWKTLAGASICWFLLDFAFFGIGMGNPRTIAKIFATWDDHTNIPKTQSWNTNPTYALNPITLVSNATIYDSLVRSPIQSMETVSIASILGSLLFIMVVNYVPRRQWLIYSFISQAVLFIVTGGTFFAVFHKENHAVTVCLVAVCHFLFNFGANTLTFMLPAELFPTTYRCTCHGIAAASGKLGSIIVLVILHLIHSNDPNTKSLGYIFIAFGGVMALGAVFAWAWIPDVQNARDEDGGLVLPSKTLEELGEGLRNGSGSPGANLGFRGKFASLRRRRGSDGS